MMSKEEDEKERGNARSPLRSKEQMHRHLFAFPRVQIARKVGARMQDSQRRFSVTERGGAKAPRAGKCKKAIELLPPSSPDEKS